MWIRLLSQYSMVYDQNMYIYSYFVNIVCENCLAKAVGGLLSCCYNFCFYKKIPKITTHGNYKTQKSDGNLESNTSRFDNNLIWYF